MLNGMMNLLDKTQKVILNFYNTRVIQKLRYKMGGKGKEVTAQTKLQARVFALKETSGRSEVSQ
jgi:hypothetical protein